MSQTQLAHEFSPLSMLRSPRPFIMIRCIRVLLKLSMPKARIKQIFKRSSHQIYNVSIFFVFFMTFYGLLGVQLFGELKHHCVRKNVSVKDVTLNDLTIPDSYCNPKSDGGHKCPKGFDCLDLSELPKVKTGFLGFGEIASSIFTGMYCYYSEFPNKRAYLLTYLAFLEFFHHTSFLCGLSCHDFLPM